MSLAGKKELYLLPVIATSHGCGKKKVLLGAGETESAITQIAVTQLKAGESVEEHRHPTMEECFFIRKGRVRIVIGTDSDVFAEDSFIRIPKNAGHSMEALTDCEMLTVGCACE